jgi:hypothetical protein
MVDGVPPERVGISGEGCRAYAYGLQGRGLHMLGFAVILDTRERRWEGLFGAHELRL